MTESFDKLLVSLGAKPSISEENGLALLREQDVMVFSPGISSGGFAEIRMAQANPKRHIIATTIDEKGLAFAQENIKKLNLENQIEARLEDLTKDFSYEENSFDFIYSRLVLHYLSKQYLEKTLNNLYSALKTGGLFFAVIRTEKDLENIAESWTLDKETMLSTISYKGSIDKPGKTRVRNLHDVESITSYIQHANFDVIHTKEYKERLYVDFERVMQAPRDSDIIEVLAKKV